MHSSASSRRSHENMTPTCAPVRDNVILGILNERGFVLVDELLAQLNVSPATLWRDIERLRRDGKLVRVRGGAVAPDRVLRPPRASRDLAQVYLSRTDATKAAIGRAAVELCAPGYAIIIGSGSTTLQMCADLQRLKLQVLTNSLYVARTLLAQADTQISVTGGTFFREQGILFSPFDNCESRAFHAQWMFVSAAAIDRHGLMQDDVILAVSEQTLLPLADKLAVLVDSSKFRTATGHPLCELSKVHTFITDDDITDKNAKMVERAGAQLIVVKKTIV